MGNENLKLSSSLDLFSNAMLEKLGLLIGFYSLFVVKVMNKNEGVTHELYNLLEILRYPEIAQTPFEQFEDTILTGTKRLDLLYWLLQECPGFNSSYLNKLKDNTVTDKLIKCYSQIGLCNDINVLLGKCRIDKQLQFFILLTLFIKNVHLVNMETQDSKSTIDTLLQTKIENANNDLSTDLQNVSIKNELESKDINILEPEILLTDKHLDEKYNLGGLSLVIKDSMKKLSDQKTDDFEPVLQDFNTTFKNLTSSTNKVEHSSIFSEYYSDLCSDIQNIYSAISNINKTLINEDKIKNLQVPEIPSKIPNPLTTTINDNIVLNEQARNIINKKNIA